MAVAGTVAQPGGTVTLFDASSPLATLTLTASGSASLTTSALTIGDHTITATYNGDTIHAPSSSPSLTQRVQQQTAVALASSLNPSKVGDLVHLTASLTGLNGVAISGSVIFSDASTSLGASQVVNGVATLDTSTLTAGTHLMVASYSGDPQNTTSISTPLSQAVNTAGTSVTLTSTANPAITTTPVTFSASVVSQGKVPTGTVEFLDGATLLGSAIVTNGVATLTRSDLPAGQHAIVARYDGDAGTQVSTSSALLQILEQRTTLNLASSLNPALTVQPIILTATLGNGPNATGVVTFLDGAISLGSVQLASNGTAVLAVPSLAAGSHALTAAYSGDTFNLSSTAAAVSQMINLRATTTSTTSSSDTYLGGAQITLVGVVMGAGPVAPTGTVTFTSGGASLGSAPVSAAGAAALTIFPLASSYDIVATYSGDAVYSASAAAKYTITAGPSTTFTISSNPSSLNLASGSHTTVDLTLTSVKGFTDIIALGCLELPVDATCTFSSDKSMLAANGSIVIHLTIDTGNPLGLGSAAHLNDPTASERSRTIQACMLLPGMGLLVTLVMIRRRRIRLPALLSLLLLLSASGLGLTGCADKLVQSTTPAGTYTVRIVASGTQSGASQVMDLPLGVTQ